MGVRDIEINNKNKSYVKTDVYLNGIVGAQVTRVNDGDESASL